MTSRLVARRRQIFVTRALLLTFYGWHISNVDKWDDRGQRAGDQAARALCHDRAASAYDKAAAQLEKPTTRRLINRSLGVSYTPADLRACAASRREKSASLRQTADLLDHHDVW